MAGLVAYPVLEHTLSDNETPVQGVAPASSGEHVIVTLKNAGIYVENVRWQTFLDLPTFCSPNYLIALCYLCLALR